MRHILHNQYNEFMKRHYYYSSSDNNLWFKRILNTLVSIILITEVTSGVSKLHLGAIDSLMVAWIPTSTKQPLLTSVKGFALSIEVSLNRFYPK